MAPGSAHFLTQPLYPLASQKPHPEAQALKKTSKDSYASWRAFQRDQTTLLWPWTQTVENGQRRRPTCTSNQTPQLLSFIRWWQMMAGTCKKAAETEGMNRFNLHFEDRITGTCWGLDLESKRRGWGKMYWIPTLNYWEYVGAIRWSEIHEGEE